MHATASVQEEEKVLVQDLGEGVFSLPGQKEDPTPGVGSAPILVPLGGAAHPR